MPIRTRVRAGTRPKRPPLPFVAPEEHYATKEDTAKIETKIAQLETKIANLRTELKSDIANSKAHIIIWVAGLQLASIGIIIAVLK